MWTSGSHGQPSNVQSPPKRVDGEQLPVHSRRCQPRDVSDALVVRVDNLRERQAWLLIVQCRKPYGVEWQGPKWLTEKR